MAGEQVVKDGEIVDVVDDTTDEVIDDTTEIVDDSTDEDESEEVETWMKEDDQQSSNMPVATHIRVKQKLKTRLSNKDKEVEELKAEVETLKKGLQVVKPTKKLERPVEDDFDTLVEYNEALSEYEDNVLNERLDTVEQKRGLVAAQTEVKKKIDKAVDSHYERAAKLVQGSGIDTEVYQKADETVRESVDSIQPGKGDIITDQIISLMGDGSEKVLYYLGRNKNALNEFKSLLIDDGTGIKASIFLGKLQQRLLTTKRKTSNAPPPDADVKGDDSAPTIKASALLKKRKTALKNGNLQAAYDAKKQAKAAGIDVSSW